MGGRVLLCGPVPTPAVAHLTVSMRADAGIVISGSHNGTSGGIATFPIPGDPCFVGQAWSAQYTVLGGGFADLSRAVHGVIGAQ